MPDEQRQHGVEYAANGPPALVIAGTFSVTAFAVALVSGGLAGRGASGAIGDALLAMALCYPVGWIVGRVANVVVTDRIAAHKRAHPVPDIQAALSEIDEAYGVISAEPLEGEVEAGGSVPKNGSGANAPDGTALGVDSPSG
jgi:hypothetical protein